MAVQDLAVEDVERVVLLPVVAEYKVSECGV